MGVGGWGDSVFETLGRCSKVQRLTVPGPFLTKMLASGLAGVLLDDVSIFLIHIFIVSFILPGSPISCIAIFLSPIIQPLLSWALEELVAYPLAYLALPISLIEEFLGRRLSGCSYTGAFLFSENIT